MTEKNIGALAEIGENLMRESMEDTLIELNSAVHYSKRDAKYEVLIEGREVEYIKSKDTFQELGVWDERYDEFHGQASKGKLNREELLKIKLK